MNANQFEEEWNRVIRVPYHDRRAPASTNWYGWVTAHLHLLSPEAKFYIADNPDKFGDWILEEISHYILEKALSLEVV